MDELKEITVCDSCLRASCWQGIFYCENYKNPGTKKLTIRILKGLAFENPHYWQNEK